jgi:membrane protease YdiL (CAAX protease family)
MRKIFSIKLNLDRDTVAITIMSTLLLMVDYYHRLTPVKVIDRVGLYLIIPLGIILLAFRKSPREFGFQLGDWRAGMVITGLAILLIAPVLWFVARADATMQDYYKRQFSAAMPIITFLDLIGWEFFFRGFILFGYKKEFGDHALWLQAVPFALMHLPKPEIETLSTIFGGFLFGLVAWRTRSFLYPFLIHWFVASFTILVAAGVFN